jgi:hypothetical protein
MGGLGLERLAGEGGPGPPRGAQEDEQVDVARAPEVAAGVGAAQEDRPDLGPGAPPGRQIVERGTVQRRLDK